MSTPHYTTAHPNKLLLIQLLVDLRLVGDVLGAMGVVEGGQSLLKVDGSRGHRRDNGGLSAAPEGVLEQPRQLRLSVR